jgi:integrase
MEDILWDLGVIFVRQGKTKKSIRYVPMSDRVRDRLAVRVEASGRAGYVFSSTRSKAKHVTLSCLSKQFRRVRDLLGLSKDLVLYTGRHSFATGLLEMTGNIKLVADTLGQADTKITGTYSSGVPQRPRGMLSQVAVSGQLKSQNEKAEALGSGPFIYSRQPTPCQCD